LTVTCLDTHLAPSEKHHEVAQNAFVDDELVTARLSQIMLPTAGTTRGQRARSTDRNRRPRTVSAPRDVGDSELSSHVPPPTTRE
jgi:hypothetical protein